jgi:hypothetical protein
MATIARCAEAAEDVLDEPSSAADGLCDAGVFLIEPGLVRTSVTGTSGFVAD